MQHAYRSFNNAVSTAWATVAAGVPLQVDSPDDADALPAECLRVYWSEYGMPTDRSNEREAIIDIAVRVPPTGNTPNAALALARCSALDAALHLSDANQYAGGSNTGRLGRFDWTTTPSTYLGMMECLPDGGWVPIPTNSPGLLHFARTVKLRYQLGAGAPFSR